jgi:hypothetical protein
MSVWGEYRVLSQRFCDARGPNLGVLESFVAADLPRSTRAWHNCANLPTKGRSQSQVVRANRLNLIVGIVFLAAFRTKLVVATWVLRRIFVTPPASGNSSPALFENKTLNQRHGPLDQRDQFSDLDNDTHYEAYYGLGGFTLAFGLPSGPPKWFHILRVDEPVLSVRQGEVHRGLQTAAVRPNLR